MKTSYPYGIKLLRTRISVVRWLNGYYIITNMINTKLVQASKRCSSISSFCVSVTPQKMKLLFWCIDYRGIVIGLSHKVFFFFNNQGIYRR